MHLNQNDALIIIDMQYDFLPGGSLAVNEGDKIIQPIASLMEFFNKMGSTIIATQDWHPKNHMSFASSHNKKPYEPINKPGIGPVLWPDHCVIGTKGASIHENIPLDYCHAIIRKGYNKNIDSYSAFKENDKQTLTGLNGYLKSRNIKRIFICGLAYDYCVSYSAIDGANMGFETYVIRDATKPVASPPDSVENATKLMTDAEVNFVEIKDIY